MRKIVFVFILVCIAAMHLQAQKEEALTNSTIVKMVKAKLSDELIIDEIRNDKVNFDVSQDALKALADQNVSQAVIQAMQAAATSQQATPEPLPVTSVAVAAKQSDNQLVTTHSEPLSNESDSLKNEPAAHANAPAGIEPAVMVATVPPTTDPQPESAKPISTKSETPVATVPVQVQEDSKKISASMLSPEVIDPGKLTIEESVSGIAVTVIIKKSAFKVNAVSYVKPAKEIITFYNSQFATLADLIIDWDKKLRSSINREAQSNEAINAIQKELTTKKNADARPFSKEIVELKGKQSVAWEKHQQLKTEMLAEGKVLIADLQKISKETENAILSKYKDVSRNIKGAKTDPSAPEIPVPVLIPEQIFNQNVTHFFTPVTMMLVAYQNEIGAFQQTITGWNDKVMNTFRQDSMLRKQLEIPQNELNKYLGSDKQTQKQKKKEINALKKQCEAIEKSRKNLASQMETDSGNFADALLKMSEEAKLVAAERYQDIIQSIEYYYKDKFND